MCLRLSLHDYRGLGLTSAPARATRLSFRRRRVPWRPPLPLRVSFQATRDQGMYGPDDDSRATNLIFHQMLTPSGRFQPDRKICFSMSDFHPGSVSPFGHSIVCQCTLMLFVVVIVESGLECRHNVRSNSASCYWIAGLTLFHIDTASRAFSPSCSRMR